MFMSSKLKTEIAGMLFHLDMAVHPLTVGVTRAFRRACEHTAHDVVVNVDPARTRVFSEGGRLEGFKKEVAIIVADMERMAQSLLGNQGIWPHRGNGDFALYESSVLAASEMGPQPPKLFVDLLGMPAVQQLKKTFEFYGYVFPHTHLLWPKFPTDELSAYLQEVRKLRELQQALAAQEAPSGSKSAEELWLKA
jgi:hypothetical protein